MPGKMPGSEGFILVFFLLLWPRLATSEPNNACHRLAEVYPPVLEMDGDVILGGLFPLHYIAPEPDHNFTHRVQDQMCSGFDLRAFRWVQTMVFAIEEINRNSVILPGVTLGYRILDSCDHVHTSLQSMFSLVSNSSAFTGSTANRSHCLSRAPIPAVIGLASSTPTRAVANTLGPFEIPLVSLGLVINTIVNKSFYQI